MPGDAGSLALNIFKNQCVEKNTPESVYSFFMEMDVLEINGPILSGAGANDKGQGAGPGGYGFEKSDRLLKRRRFIQLSRKGYKVHSALFLAAVMTGETPGTRIGITVTKKIGSAVARNRIKRQVREFFRINKKNLPKELDVNVIAKKGAAAAGSEKLRVSLDELFERIKGRERSKHWQSS